MKTLSRLLILSTLCLSLIQCADKKPNPFAEPDFSNEIERYATCLEKAVPRTHESYERYLSWVDPETGPTCQERYVVYGLYPLYHDSIAKCNGAAELGAANKLPFPTLETAAAVFAKVNEELVPLAQKASAYYLQGQYKNDDCAQGKAMHAKLIQLFKQHQSAERTLYDEIAKVKKSAKAYAVAQAAKNK